MYSIFWSRMSYLAVGVQGSTGVLALVSGPDGFDQQRYLVMAAHIKPLVLVSDNWWWRVPSCNFSSLSTSSPIFFIELEMGDLNCMCNMKF
jgi:hypothetical protein